LLPNYTAVITPQERVMTWLARGVPLALLADLADPAGPNSREILTAEAVADDVNRDHERLLRRGREVADQDFSGSRSA
jgi:hypothetical protein